MSKLLKINEETNLIDLNKEWLLLIPAFANLIKRDKGSEGDYRGDKKLKARREISWIWFMLDFSSPLFEWDKLKAREEAMRWCDLTEKDIDDVVMTAYEEYQKLLNASSRSLRTLTAAMLSLDKFDEYFETMNFTDRDKKGELLNDPQKYLGNLQKLDSAYAALDKFKARVSEELRQAPSIRGSAELGSREMGRGKTSFHERGNPNAEESDIQNIDDAEEESNSREWDEFHDDENE